MPKVDVVPGMFSWIDLMTTDAGGAKEFYSGVFGWSHQDMPTDQERPYTIFSKDDVPVAGLGELPDDMKSAGVPPAWNSYIQVSDLDETVARVEPLGGAVEMPPMDVMDLGRMAVIRDASGAHVSLWQSIGEAGAGVFNEHGALTWNELVTRDPGAARGFYGKLMGWEWDEMEMPQGMYLIIMNRGRPNGGILPMDDEWPAETPAHWMVYIGAEDVDAAAERVTGHGGAIHVEPTDIQVGRFAVVSDPAGAVFTLFKGGDM